MNRDANGSIDPGVDAYANDVFYWIQYLLQNNMLSLIAFAHSVEAERFEDLNMPTVLWVCAQDEGTVKLCVVGMNSRTIKALTTDVEFMREMHRFGPKDVVVRASLMLSGPRRDLLPLGMDSILRTISFRGIGKAPSQKLTHFNFNALDVERKSALDAVNALDTECNQSLHQPPLPTFPLELAFGAFNYQTIARGDHAWKSQRRTCSWCAKPCITTKCSRCKTPYCSLECLDKDNEVHKPQCRIAATIPPRHRGTRKAK